MGFKLAGSPTSSILTIEFASGAGSTILVDADATPILTVSKDGSVVSTVTDAVRTSTGTYEGMWTPAVAGEYDLLWSFQVSGTDYSVTDTVFAFDFAASADVPDAPDVGTSNVCLITGTFIDASGNFLQGVYVRFSPSIESARLLGVGFVAADITTESDQFGRVSFNVVRGITGLLTISGSSIVRNVLIPSQETIDLFELASQGSDLLEIQELQLTPLPRRS